VIASRAKTVQAAESREGSMAAASGSDDAKDILATSAIIDKALGKDRSAGFDSKDVKFPTLHAMWSSAIEKGVDAWYNWGIEYYKKQPATVDGVLGGLEGLTNAPDVEHSLGLLKVWAEERVEKLGGKAGGPKAAGGKSSIAYPMKGTRALDLGGGMGRVSAAVLGKVFAKVDLAESSEAMVEAAKKHIPKEMQGDLAVATMQDFEPAAGRQYTCVWMQFAAGYLLDEHLVRLLQNCAKALDDHPASCVIMKESVTYSDD